MTKPNNLSAESEGIPETFEVSPIEDRGVNVSGSLKPGIEVNQTEPSSPLEYKEKIKNPQPSSSELVQILEAIQLLSTEIQSLRQGFDSKIKYDTSKERIIDTLHKDLQTYREGLHFKILRPLFLDLISMHDDFSNLSNYDEGMGTEAESQTTAKLRENLMSFQQTVEDILDKYDVEVYSEEGEQFVPQRQRAIKRIETDDPTKNRLIAKRIRKGFAYEGKVLRPEFVATYNLIEQQVQD